MQIQLNARDYVVAPRKVRRNGRDILVPVEEYDVELFTQSFDTLGGQSQERIGPYTSWIAPNFMLGFGRDRTASDSFRNIDERRRFFNSTCDTRRVTTYLPILEEDSTETGLEVVRVFANFKGDLWAIWEDDTGTDLVSRKYTGASTAWTDGGVVTAAGVAFVGLDLIAPTTHLIVVTALTNDHSILRSTDGATWASPSVNVTSNLFTNNVTVHEDINGGLLAHIGAEDVAILWHEANGTITFFSSTDAGDNWSDEAVDIASGDGPHGVAVYPGIDGEDKLYVLTMEGLYELDTAPATWTFQLIFPTPGGIAVYGRRMIVGDDGAVWFSVGVDDDTPAPFYRMVVSGDSRIITSVGLNLGDGVISDMLGSVRYMTSAGGFMFASIGGGKASRNARIVTWNGKGWHSMRKHGTANEKIEAIAISSADDNLVRLHYAIRTGDATSDTVFLGQPLVNPASGVSIKRETTGFIDLPYIDGGMPLIAAAWLRFGINASALSATNSGEFIQMTYGLNGASRTTSPSTPFEFVSGTLTQALPASADGTPGVGVSARNIGTRVTLNRDGGTNTDTPELEDVEINYLKIPSTLEGYIFTVDVKASTGTDEQVISDLKTARNLSTLPILVYGPSGNHFVKVRSIRWFPEVTEGSVQRSAAPDALMQRGGFWEVTCEEVI